MLVGFKDDALQLALAFPQRLRPQVGTIQPHQIEGPNAQLGGPFPHQRDEVRLAFGVTCRVDDGGVAGQARQRIADISEALCNVVAATAVEGDFIAVFMKLDAEAIELHLLNPVRPCWRLLPEDGSTWFDEGDDA